MKIVKKETLYDGNTTEFNFDNGAWVTIYNGGHTEEGCWEFQENLYDDNSYISGCISFHGNVVEDYDGCFELPEEVKYALADLGCTFDD